MKKKSRAQNSVHLEKGHPWIAGLIILGGLGLLFLVMAFSITKGAAEIPLSSVWDALFRFDEQDKYHLIIMDLRLPRVIVAALVGAAFAVSGAIMQGITRNPLADSGLMGLNAGACFAVSICLALYPTMEYMQMMRFGFLGAAFGAALVGGIAFFNKGASTPMSLILAGAAVSALLTALSQGIALYFDVAQDMMFWTAGGVAGANWQHVRGMLPWIVIGLIAAIALAPSISLLSLGEEVAKGLGLNTLLVNILCSVVVVILIGASVSAVGAVAFVGLIIPHVARFLVGVDYRLIIPCSAVLGALLVVMADLGAKTLNPPFETPIGALISVIGVPFFLYLARKQRRAL